MVDEVRESMSEKMNGYKEVEINGKMVDVPEEWELKKIDHVSTLIISNVDKKIHSSETRVKLCNYLHVYRNRYITNTLLFDDGSATFDEITKFSLLKDDVIITKDSEESNDIAIPAWVAESFDNLICGYHLAILRPKKNLNGNYFAKILELPLINQFFQTRANGVTRFGLTQNTIQNAPILLPPLPEQKKIAEILTSVDKAIQSTQAVIEQTKKVKQGLMRELLTRGIGHTKLKQVELNGKMVEVPEEWGVKRIEDVSTLIVSNVDKKIYPNEKKVNLCNYLHIYRNRYITNELQFDEGSVTIDELSKFGLLKDDVVITKDSEESNDIAIPAYVVDQIMNLVCGYHLAILRPKKNIIGIFLAKLLELPLINLFFQTRANGVTRFGLTLNTIQSAPILLPSLYEQKKIAEILTSVDEATQSSQDKLAQLQTLKKGMMQDLLTGKVRVKIKKEE